MAVTLFFLTIGIWISCVLSDPWLVTGFAGLWGLVLWIHFLGSAFVDNRRRHLMESGFS